MSPALAGGFLTTAPPGKLPFYTLSLMVCEIHLNRIRKKAGKLISQNQRQRSFQKKEKIQKEQLKKVGRKKRQLDLGHFNQED